jgi:hypothetical protein
MCTVTWFHQPGGYQLFSNRDEKRTRKPATGPELQEQNGVRFVAPVDGDFGGSWIATNEFGLSLCLVNGLGERPQETRSRGLVLTEWIAAPELAALRELVDGSDLGAVAPFSMVALQPRGSARVIRWNGVNCELIEERDAPMPLVSSSFDPDGVTRSRRDLLEQMCRRSSQTGAFLAFHRSHQPERGPYSPCMHRPDAHSVSFTWVNVTADEAAMYYAPGAPCSSLAGESRLLPIGAPRNVAGRAGRPQPCVT